MDYRPGIQLVPAPLWGLNLRLVLTRKEWQRLREGAIAERGLRCQCCGGDVAEAKKINAHEVWEYDSTVRPARAKLVGIELSCWTCHQCEHYGHLNTKIRSGEWTEAAREQVIEHFCRLNGVGRDIFDQHCRDAYEEWARLSALEWVIDWGVYQSLMPAKSLRAWFDPDGNPVRWLAFAQIDEDAVSAFLTDLAALSRFYGVWIGQTNRRNCLPLHIRDRCIDQGRYVGELRDPGPLPADDPNLAEYGSFMTWTDDPIRPLALEDGLGRGISVRHGRLVHGEALEPGAEKVMLAALKFRRAQKAKEEASRETPEDRRARLAARERERRRERAREEGRTVRKYVRQG